MNLKGEATQNFVGSLLGAVSMFLSPTGRGRGRNEWYRAAPSGEALKRAILEAGWHPLQRNTEEIPLKILDAP